MAEKQATRCPQNLFSADLGFASRNLIQKLAKRQPVAREIREINAKTVPESHGWNTDETRIHSQWPSHFCIRPCFIRVSSVASLKARVQKRLPGSFLVQFSDNHEPGALILVVARVSEPLAFAQRLGRFMHFLAIPDELDFDARAFQFPNLNRALLA